MRNIRII